MKKTSCLFLVGLALLFIQSQIQACSPDEGAEKARQVPIHSWDRERPPVIDPGTVSLPDQPGKPPSDATILFDGKDLSAWRATDGGPAKWVIKDQAMESTRGSGYVRTLRGFGDCQLHVEWATPSKVEGKSQGRGNSGVFLMGLYEIQVLDSYDNDTYPDGQAAAVYGQYPPQVNASRPPGVWQVYDIVFHRPHFDTEGKLTQPGRLTVFHNGVLVQDNVEVLGPTTWMYRPPYKAHGDRLPLALQDHGNPVRFRNIWVRELPARPLADRDKDMEIVLSPAQLDAYVGKYGQGGLSVDVTREGETLFARFGGRPPSPIYPRTETLFFSREIGIEYEFTPGAAGTMQEVLIKHGQDRIGPAKRKP